MHNIHLLKVIIESPSTSIKMYPQLIATVLLLILSQCEKTSAAYDKFYNIRSTYHFPAEGQKGNHDFAAQRCKDLGSSLVRVENSMELHDLSEFVEVRFNRTRNDEPFWTGAVKIESPDFTPSPFWSWNGKHPMERVKYTSARWCLDFPKMKKEDEQMNKVVLHRDKYSPCIKNALATHNYYFICEKRVVLKL